MHAQGPSRLLPRVRRARVSILVHPMRGLPCAALLALLLMTGTAEPAAAASSSVIRTCYNKRPTHRGFRTYGNLRPLLPGKRCGPRENFLSWNATGGAGGARGPTGVTGATGP